MATNADILRSKGYTYLYHISKMDNFNEMEKNPFVMTPIERHQEKVDVLGVLQIEEISFDHDFYEIGMGGYPGIYMGITSKSLEELREYFSDGCLLIFPLELMNQKNWHFNIQDRNGFFFPDTIPFDQIHEIPSSDVMPKFNEVIFHNRISLCNLVEVIGNGSKWRPEFHLTLDLETPPSYIYYTGSFYSGIQYPFFRSPSEKMVSKQFMYQWYQKYLPSPYKEMMHEEMDFVQMDLFLKDTLHAESGMNLVDHYFRHRIPI